MYFRGTNPIFNEPRFWASSALEEESTAELRCFIVGTKLALSRVLNVNLIKILEIFFMNFERSLSTL